MFENTLPPVIIRVNFSNQTRDGYTGYERHSTIAPIGVLGDRKLKESLGRWWESDEIRREGT